MLIAHEHFNFCTLFGCRMCSGDFHVKLADLTSENVSDCVCSSLDVDMCPTVSKGLVLRPKGFLFYEVFYISMLRYNKSFLETFSQVSMVTHRVKFYFCKICAVCFNTFERVKWFDALFFHTIRQNYGKIWWS